MDVRTLFAKPKLLLYIPSGPVSRFTSWDFQTNRDYVVQGELLKFYLVVSFSRMLDSSSAKKDAVRQNATSPVLSNVTSPPSSPAPSGPPSLPSSPLAGSVTEQYTNTSAFVYLQQVRELFKRLKMSIRFQKISADNTQNYIPVSAVSKVVGYKDFSSVSRPAFLDKSSKDAATSPAATEVLSAHTNGSTPAVSPIAYEADEIEIQASEADCIVLDNGDFAFPLQVLIGIDDSFLNQRLTLVVSVSPAEKQLSLDDLLGAGGVSFMEKSPPVRFIGKQLYLYDPLQINFSTKRMHQRYLITASLENTHTDPIAISNIQLHLMSVNNVKSSFSELQKFFRADVILPPDVQLPLMIRQKEKYDFLISADLFPVAPVDSIDLAALKPVILIDWVNAAASSWMQSQFAVPFPDPVRHASLLFSFEISPSSALNVNEQFTIKVTISNLKDYARNLSLEIPLPVHHTNISNNYQKVSPQDAENPERRSSDGIVSATPENVLAAYRDHMVDSASVFFLERHHHIGFVGPHSEASVTFSCLPLAKGLFKFNNIKIVEQNPLLSQTPLVFIPETQFEVFIP